MATPSWQEQLPPSQRLLGPWSVSFWLHRYLRARHGHERLTSECIIYVALYLDHKSSRSLTQRSNQLNMQWLSNGSSILPLKDGMQLDLAPALKEGRVWVASFGPERCRIVNNSPLRESRRIYFDRSFGACDEKRGIMAPAFAAAATTKRARQSRRSQWRDELRRHEIFFYGHVPKPCALQALDPEFSATRASMLLCYCSPTVPTCCRAIAFRVMSPVLRQRSQTSSGL